MAFTPSLNSERSLVISGPLLTNAILMIVALVALLGVAQRLWPSRPDASAVAVLLVTGAVTIRDEVCSSAAGINGSSAAR